MAIPKSPLTVDPIVAGAPGLSNFPDVRIQYSKDDQDVTSTMGLEILCNAAVPCIVPETCVHVRRALRARCDAPILHYILRAWFPAPQWVRMRIPLAPSLWVQTDVGYLSNKDGTWWFAQVGEHITSPMAQMQLGNHGAEDLKWQLVGAAAQTLDAYRFNKTFVHRMEGHREVHASNCIDCREPFVLDISDQEDFAWVVTWLNHEVDPFDITQPRTCPDCVKRQARDRYGYRSSLAFALTFVSKEW